MKTLFPFALFALFAGHLFAGSPSYSSFTASGTTGAEVIFPADPVLQIRVVGVIGSSDKAASVFQFSGGGTPGVISFANTNTAATNIYVSGYVGFSTNDLLVIQAGTSNKSLTIFGLNNSTNIMTTSAVGIAQTVGMEIFDMGTTNKLKCGHLRCPTRPALARRPRRHRLFQPRLRHRPLRPITQFLILIFLLLLIPL